MKDFVYPQDHAGEISFPLGGIGTGCIGLAGNGQLVDVEIMGKPNKGSHALFTHFAVKVEDDEKVLDVRVANGDVQPPYSGKHNRAHFNSFGFGVDRAALSGLPHFQSCTFQGKYPVATLSFADPHFPGTLEMQAFNPFLPHNDRDSSIPGAFFCFTVTNTGDRALTYTVALTATNLYTRKGGDHRQGQEGETRYIYLGNRQHGDCPSNRQHGDCDPLFGDMTIATDAARSSSQLYWYRGSWFDNLSTYWKDFSAFGPIKPRTYTNEFTIADANYAADDSATLAAHIKVQPGATGNVRFVLTWNTPNSVNYWNPEPCEGESGCCEGAGNGAGTWKNYYATLFSDSKQSALYAMENFDRLYDQTRLFRDTLFASSMPPEALDAVSANLAVIKSPTCLRLEDGSLYGFEGCHCDSGCCEGSCTHVWSYAYAIPFLFPKLERSMRTLEYTHSMNDDGAMGFRLQLPVGRSPSSFRPCVDGQYATVMRVYREYKISGDIDWLRQLWPQVRQSIAYAWSPGNYDRWDPDQNGILDGRQHHTLDMELFGKNAWLSGMYLGGLKAGAELAAVVGDEKAAALFDRIFDKGKAFLNSELYNGEYYRQRIDLKDRTLLDPYQTGTTIHRQDVYKAYWNEEQQELMYQIADGCGIDQVLAQWHANLMGLGEIFEKKKCRSALAAIYRNNFIPSFREHVNPCRIFGLNDEAGLVICTWPEGVKAPFIPIPYAEESMHGFEYQAAIHMIQEGMVDEGMTCIRAIRDRYDGKKRNPWNEFECGSNYARSMASFALLLTFSGFRYDIPRHHIGFAPIGDRNDFRSFWSVDNAWGNIEYSCDKVVLSILYGEITLSSLQVEKDLRQVVSVSVDGRPADFRCEGETVVFPQPMQIEKQVDISYLSA